MNRMARTLIRLIRETVGKPMLGAEVGVWEGGLSETLLRSFRTLTLRMVDRYILYLPGGTGTLSKVKTQAEMHTAMVKALDRTEFAAHRRILMVGKSDYIGRIQPEGILDFVFIDADHSREAVYRDLDAWLPVVRKGGLVSGHDYGGRRQPGVARAVDEFAERWGIEVRVAAEKIWWFVK